MARIASLVLTIGNAPGGVVLVDGIENGLHHSIMPDVWRVMGGVARQFNTQVFATTYSLECITAAHKAFVQSEAYDFRLHRLERKGELVHVATYDRETLEAGKRLGEAAQAGYWPWDDDAFADVRNFLHCINA